MGDVKSPDINRPRVAAAMMSSDRSSNGTRSCCQDSDLEEVAWNSELAARC